MGKFHNSRRINIAFTSYVHAIPYYQYINVFLEKQENLISHP